MTRARRTKHCQQAPIQTPRRFGKAARAPSVLKAVVLIGLMLGMTAFARARTRDHNSACLRAHFDARVNAGQSFRHPLGNGLALHLDPLKNDGGWQIRISPEGSDEDWAYPVNPPLRFGNSEDLGTGYGIPVRRKLSYAHEVRFPLTNADYARIFDLAYKAIWPDQAKQRPEKAAAAYAHALKTVRTGALLLSPLDYDKDGPPDRIRWMKFSAVVIVPRGFHVGGGMIWTRGSCNPEVPSGIKTHRTR